MSEEEVGGGPCSHCMQTLCHRSRTGPPRASAGGAGKQGGLGTGGSQRECACLQKPRQAVTGTSYLVHSPPPEREQDTVRLRDGSTQHVRGKQFIFLPQLLTGVKIKRHEVEAQMNYSQRRRKRTTAEPSGRQAYEDKFTKAKQFTAEQNKEGKKPCRFKKKQKTALVKRPMGK